MKIIFLIVCQLFAGSLILVSAQGANKALSNLSTTSINQSLIPGSNNTLDLGSASASWKDFYLSGLIYVEAAPAINLDGSTTAIGKYSLNSNTSSSPNTAIGYNSLKSNTSGSLNTATGYNALVANSTGSWNAAFGYESLSDNLIGNGNTAFGTYSLRNGFGSSNNYNTAVGYSALGTALSSGQDNTAIGAEALTSNTSGSSNTALGRSSLLNNSDGIDNTASGMNSLQYNSTGTLNAAFGKNSLINNTTASKNTAVGAEAGAAFVNGNKNTFFGYNADAFAEGITNSSAIGTSSRVTASNQVRIGNTLVISIGGYASWSNISDGRIKKNVKENVSGLEFINKLRPVTYTLDIHAIDKKMNIKEEEEDLPSIAEKEKMIYSGFIAQEVEEAANEAGYNFSGVDAPKNENDLYSLRYAEFVVPLVKAVQELSENNEELNGEIEMLKAKINEIQSPEKYLPAKDDSKEVLLGQNIPNPFEHSTIIPFRLPTNCGDAMITVVETVSGNVVAAIPLREEETFVKIDASSFGNGNYTYSLLINGTMVASKQMEVVR